jgi:D-inositol-3-phosphate glycosyltransferase
MVGPLAPWRGGLAQYLALMGEALMPHAEVSGITFTRQYPDLLFPGETQFDPETPRPAFPTRALLDSIGPWSWKRTARALETFAPGAVILKWWMPFFGPAFASSVGPLRRRGTRVVLVCDNLVPHEKRPFDRAFTRWMLRNSDGYLVMSESVERDLERLKPGAPYRRILHPLYAQFDRGRWTRASARAKLGLEGDVLLFFGYVRRYKGLDTLLGAWPRARARRPVLRGSGRVPPARRGGGHGRAADPALHPRRRGGGAVQGLRRRRAAVPHGHPERRHPRGVRAR